MRLYGLGVLALLCATSAAAAAPEKGAYSAALRDMLTRTASGTCPADLMGETLLNACREQMPKMGPALKAAGPIKSVTFVKADQIKGMRTETYKVAFQKGAPSTWHIGGLKNGKFESAYSND